MKMEAADSSFVRASHPRDLPLRFVRLFLAIWLLVGPYLLGFGGTFPQRQDAVAGLSLLGLMALGLFVPGMRVALIVVGGWLIASPRASFEYTFLPVAYWHDSVVGLALLVLGLLPVWREDRDVVVDRREISPGEEERARRWGIWRPRRRVTP